MCKANLSTWTVRKWRSYYRLLSHTPLTICLLTPWLTAWTLHRARLPSGSGARGSRRSQSQVTWAAATPEPALIGRDRSRDLNTALWLDETWLMTAGDWLSGGTGHSGSLGGVGTFTSLHAKPTRSAGKGETITRHGVWRPGSGRTRHRGILQPTYQLSHWQDWNQCNNDQLHSLPFLTLCSFLGGIDFLVFWNMTIPVS